jgi:hypothetical protein
LELAPFTPFKGKPTIKNKRLMALQMINFSDEVDDQIIEGLVEIIAIEGPTLTTRAFNLYAKNGGIAKLTPTVTKRIMVSLKKAVREKKILLELDIDSDKSIGLLWLPTMQKIIPREYGARGFIDIPTSELGEVMFELAGEVGQKKVPLYRKIVEIYGLNQLPKNASTRLNLVYKDYIT